MGASSSTTPWPTGRPARPELVKDGDAVNFFLNKDTMCDAIKSANDFPSNLHYSQLPVEQVKSMVHRFRPVHRLRLDTFRKVLECGSLQSAHLRAQIADAPFKVLCKQVRSDLSLRALMLRHVHDVHGADYILSWTCAEASLRLSQLLQKPLEEVMAWRWKAMSQNLIMREMQQWKGVLFNIRENKEIAAATVGVASAGAAIGIAVATAGVAGPVAATAVGTGMGAAAATGTIVGLILLTAMQKSSAIAPGGAALTLMDPFWDLNGATGTIHTRLRSIDSSQITDDEALWLHSLDANLSEEAQRAAKVRDLLTLLIEKAQDHAKNIAEYAPTGINYRRDADIGTNRHVFAIVGPHFGTYYGEICIVLKQSVMYEPDFDMTPCAGTGFLSRNARIFNTWLEHGEFANMREIDQFHTCKLNAGVLGWRSVMSAALAHAVTQHKLQHKSVFAPTPTIKDVSTEDVVNFLSRVDSHCAIEAHLPEIVPLSHYVEKIVIPNGTFTRLTDSERLRLNELVGEDRIVRVSDTIAPAAIISNCFETLGPGVPENGHSVQLLPWTHRSLRGLQPRNAQSGEMRVRVSGEAQLLLVHDDAWKLMVGVGKVSVATHDDLENVRAMLSQLSSSSPFSVQDVMSQIATHALEQENGTPQPVSTGRKECWMLTPFNQEIVYFNLDIAADAFVDLKVVWTTATTTFNLSVVDKVADNIVVDHTLDGCFKIDVIKANTFASHAQLSSLKVK